MDYEFYALVLCLKGSDFMILTLLLMKGTDVSKVGSSSGQLKWLSMFALYRFFQAGLQLTFSSWLENNENLLKPA